MEGRGERMEGQDREGGRGGKQGERGGKLRCNVAGGWGCCATWGSVQVSFNTVNNDNDHNNKLTETIMGKLNNHTCHSKSGVIALKVIA